MTPNDLGLVIVSRGGFNRTQDVHKRSELLVNIRGERESFGDPKKSGHPNVNRAETDRLDIEASIPRLAGGLWGADLSAADLRDQVFLDLDRRSRNSKLIAFVRFRIATQRA